MRIKNSVGAKRMIGANRKRTWLGGVFVLVALLGACGADRHVEGTYVAPVGANIDRLRFAADGTYTQELTSGTLVLSTHSDRFEVTNSGLTLRGYTLVAAPDHARPGNGSRVDYYGLLASGGRIYIAQHEDNAVLIYEHTP